MRARGAPIPASLSLLLVALLLVSFVGAARDFDRPIPTNAAAAPSLPASDVASQADSSPPVIPDADAAESAALADAIREIEEEEAEEAAEATAVASEPAPEAKTSSSPAAAPSPSAASFDLYLSPSSLLTEEERERRELAAADLALARSRGDAAAEAVAFARLRDADAEKGEEDEDDDEEDELERKWRPFKMRDQSEDEEEEEREREKRERREKEEEKDDDDESDDDESGRRREASKASAASKSTARPSSAPAANSKKQAQQQQQEQPHITPPFDPRWPSPAGVAFAALAPNATKAAVAQQPPLSLSSALPPEYDASVGGRGLPASKDKIQMTSFAAARAAREAARRADRWGREPEDLMAAEGERPRPRRETMLTAGLIGVSKPNAYGARPDDIPVVAPTPLVVSEWKSGAPPRDGKDASRVVIDKNASSAPFELTFAANAAVDQPTRRFRPPDQSLCVGNGVVITGNNLVLRTWDAKTGAPLQGPIAQPDFFGLDGNFSDPVCIFDSQDTRRFFVGVFRFGEGATKYSQFVLAVSKTSDPAGGFLGPYVFRNDGLDREGKPLPGLDDCAGSGDDDDGGGGAEGGAKKSGASPEGSKKATSSKKASSREERGRERENELSSQRSKPEASSSSSSPSSISKLKQPPKKKVQPGCLGDYPAVGLDANAFVATFNLFQTEPEEKYAGVLALAIDKRGLVSGASAQPAFVAYSNFNAEISYTVQPSQTQAGTPHDSGRGGTIYLVSTGPCTQNEPNVNMVAAWAMTNTSALATPGFGERGSGGDGNVWTIPHVSKAALVEVPAYRDPGAFKAERLAMPQPDPGVPIDSGDARTLQHVLSGGVLWFSAQTAAHVGSADAPLSVAVAYWALLPSWNETAEEPGGLSANVVVRKSLPGAASNKHTAAFAPRLVASGYVAPPPSNSSPSSYPSSLARPAITATRDGRAWVSALLTGPATNPTQVAASVDLATGPVSIHAPLLSPAVLGPTVPDKKWKGAAAARASKNDNSNQLPPGANRGGTLRGGDYGGATLDESGDVWLAGMWSGGVPSASCVAKFTQAKCPSWGTIVNKIKATAAATAAERASSLGLGGSVVAAKGVAGASVPGARAGEWAAKAARAKAEAEEREEREREEGEKKGASAAAAVAPAPSSFALSATASSALFPSAATYDPDDVPERVDGGGGKR